MPTLRRIVRVFKDGLLWPVRSPRRLLVLGWFIAITFVGAVGNAVAAPGDDLFGGQDITDGSAPTVFERVPFTAYQLPANISPDATGFLGLMRPVFMVFIGLGDVLLFLGAALVKGSILAVQWFLSLGGLYHSNQGTIDVAVRGLANSLFWPLIGCTVAFAALTLYGKAKKDGGASILGEAAWMIVASVLAITFATAPSKVVTDLDQFRQQVSDAAATGYANARGAALGSPAGFPAVQTPDTTHGSIRALADGLWQSYWVAPWCEAAFGDLKLCADVGKDYLENTDRWKSIDQQMTDLNSAINALGGPPAVGADGEPVGGQQQGGSDTAPVVRDCPAEIPEASCDWVRGQHIGRTGMVVMTLILAIPAALMLLALVIYGVMAFVGFVLLILLGVLFLLGCMIPGRLRQWSVKWAEALLGSMLQTVMITALLGGVMVLSGLIATMGAAGLFGQAILNVAVIAVALRFRNMFDNLTGLAHPGGGGMNSYLTYKALGGLTKSMKSLGSAFTKGGMAGAKGAVNTGRAVAPHLEKGARAAGSFAATEVKALRGQFARKPQQVGDIAPEYRTGPNHPQPALPAGHAATLQHGAKQLGPAPAQRPEALPGGQPHRKALPVAASSTAAPLQGNQMGAPPKPAIPLRSQKQGPARTFEAPTGQAGVVSSAQRRLVVQPTRWEPTHGISSKPAGPQVVSYGHGSPYQTATRQGAPKKVPGMKVKPGT